MFNEFIKSLIVILTLVHFTQIKASDLPLEAFSDMPLISLVRISPDGDRIAYRSLVDNEDYLLIREIFTGKILGGFVVGDINPSHAYFVNQDKLILIATSHKKIWGFAGRHDISTAFIYDLKTNSVQQMLTPGRGIYRGQSGLGRVVGLSPDLEYAYMPAFVGKSGSRPNFNLMRVNLEKPRRIKTAKRGNNNTIDYFLDQDGNVLAREEYNNNRNIHSVDALIDDDWVEIFSEETEIISKSFVGLTPDRKSLVMLASPDGEQNAYYAMSLKDGSISEPLFYREDASIEQVLTDKQRVVYGVRYSGFKPDYAFFEDKLTKTYQAIQDFVPNNAFRIIDHTPDWQSILFFVEGDKTSGDYLLYKNGEFHFFTSARPAVRGDRVATIRAHYFEARDGLTIPTLITYPVGTENALNKLPAIVMPHGGPASYDTISFDWMAQYFANRGYVVIQPQFRGSTGFGREFTRKGHGEWGRKMQDDLTDAVLHFAEMNIIDKEKVCIVGWSYGGYAALAGSVFTPDLYQCVVSINGVSDLEEMIETEEKDHGRNHWVVSYWNKIIANEKLDDDFFDSISPVNFADNVTAPVLLIHGDEDTVVPLEQSEDMADALEDAGKQVQFVEIEGEGHSISNNNANRLILLKAIDQFVTQHLPRQ